MRIQSNTQALQLLRAQQAFQARRGAVPQPSEETLQPEATPVADSPLASASVPAFARTEAWQRTVSEVRDIARQAGYVGLSEQDIQRAYARGESLLADYRV